VRDTIRHGRRVRSGGVVLHFVAGTDATRATVVAGRAIGDSVTRHRRQRQLRHALAAMWEELPAGALVVRAVPDASTEPAGDLRRAVRKL